MKNLIPFAGRIGTASTTSLWLEEITTYFVLKKPPLAPRFAAQITDDGLEGFNIHPEDFLIFSRQDWPSNEEQVTLVQFRDGTYAVRILRGLFDREPTLAATGDRYEPWEYSRSQFRVLGVMVGVIRSEDGQMVSQVDLDTEYAV